MPQTGRLIASGLPSKAAWWGEYGDVDVGGISARSGNRRGVGGGGGEMYWR